ncbi:hypothetical protein FPOA_12154 [Fusarium poae]|uniref:HAT C-terminal dimerisation domain-containing protein n=1 Tax=Fusarium poae TaxID=36050 RepID=A0A1B8AA52_FUSPO|nr:hypothetical protein FPOA_12154 [Fusarium poae]
MSLHPTNGGCICGIGLIVGGGFCHVNNPLWSSIIPARIGSASETSQKSTLPADHRTYIRASINNGWEKLNEYYEKLGESPLFAAAVILHPRFGISWLEATWVSEEQLAWVRDAKAGIKDYFTRWYDANQGLCEETTKYDAAPRTMGQEDDQYTQWINSKTKKAFATGGSVGELERYLRLEPQDTQDAIEWWRDHRASFPSLSSFALDVFAIPAMRLSMGADTLEHVQCLKNWVRQGGVVQPRQVDGDVTEAFDDDGNIGEVAMSKELGQTWCGKAGGDSKWGRRGLVEDWT